MADKDDLLKTKIAELDSTHAELTSVQKEAAAVREKVVAWCEICGASPDKTTQLTELLSRASDALKAKLTELDLCKDDRKMLANGIEAEGEKVSERDGLIANLEAAIGRSKQRLATLEVEVEDAKEKSGLAAPLESAVVSLYGKIAGLKDDMFIEQEKVREKDDRISSLETSVANLQTKLREWKTRLATLRRLSQSMQGLHQQANELMLDADEVYHEPS